MRFVFSKVEEEEDEEDEKKMKNLRKSRLPVFCILCDIFIQFFARSYFFTCSPP